MKKEFLEPVSIDSSVSRSQNTSIEFAEIPAELTRCLTVEALITLKLPVIKTLAYIHSKDVIYQLLKDIDSIVAEELELLLKSEKCMSEFSFWDAATRVHVALDNGYVEKLQSEGMTFEKDEDTSAFLARAINKYPEKLNQYVKELTLVHSGAVGDKTCHVFESPVPSTLADSFSRIKPEELKATLLLPFEKRGYEDHCELSYFENDEVVGFKVNRGARRTMSRVRDLEKTKRYRDDQKLKDDTIYFVKDTNAIWISCAGVNDAQMYASVVSSLMTGRDTVGLRKQFDLSVFLDRNLGSVLTGISQSMGFARTEVRAVKIILATGGKLEHSRKQNETCMTDIFHSLQAIDPANEMVYIKLRIVYDLQGKNWLDLELKLGSLKMDLGLSALVVNQLLSELEVWKVYANA